MGRLTPFDVDPAAPVGTIVGAVVDDVDVAVVRHDGGWVMVPDGCTHARCPFSSDGEVVDGAVLVCNCHGSEFDLGTGDVLVGPAEEPLVIRSLSFDADGWYEVGGGRGR
jgi:nitrite reductase/ring-hydroxylating ferredoxin subunit